MKLAKLRDQTTYGWAVQQAGVWHELHSNLDELLAAPDLDAAVRQALGAPLHLRENSLPPTLAPLDSQEVWAAGVTYRRSQEARKRESKGSSYYDHIYNSERPELFLKATPHRAVGTDEAVGIRADSAWNVPEPELALVLNQQLDIVGFTIGNDMSSRDIEGENPLYLPQAKVYDRCVALGPWIVTADEIPNPMDLSIELEITRADSTVFQGETATSSLNRKLSELCHYLGRCNHFPKGAILLTGTGIVPPDSFTLLAGDIVTITIEGIGSLTNPVQELPL